MYTKGNKLMLESPSGMKHPFVVRRVTSTTAVLSPVHGGGYLAVTKSTGKGRRGTGTGFLAGLGWKVIGLA